MKNNTNETFKMYCPKCNREYTVDAFEQNPVCKHDGAGLDFEPKKVVVSREKERKSNAKEKTDNKIFDSN